MQRWHWASFTVCVVLTAVALWQRGQIASALGAADTVTVSRVEAPQVVVSNIDEQPAASDDESRELARLRNEVTQLRARKRDLDGARRENTSLIAATNIAPITRPEPPPGFVAKEKLANVGFATPEDALQTFFWAMREGNLRAITATLSPNNSERQQFEKLTPEQQAERERAVQGKSLDQMMLHFNDVGVRARQTLSDDHVVLHIGSSLSTNTMKMPMERTPEGWKILEPSQ